MKKRIIELIDFPYLYRYTQKMFKETPKYAMTNFLDEYPEDHISMQYDKLKKEWLEISKRYGDSNALKDSVILIDFVQSWPIEIYQKYLASSRAQKFRDNKKANHSYETRTKRIELKVCNIDILNELKLEYKLKTYDEVIERLTRSTESVTP